MRIQISKTTFYRHDGLMNKNLFRLFRNGAWTYWKNI